jgi:transketolase C-terminal domain/subunit
VPIHDFGLLREIQEQAAHIRRDVLDMVYRRQAVPVEIVSLADTFAETGPDPETLMDAWGLSVEDIVQAAVRVFGRKAHRSKRRSIV